MVKNQFIEMNYIRYGAFFFLTNIMVAFMYFTSVRNTSKDLKTTWKTFLFILPIFLAITLGLSLHNALAAIRGWLGEKTPFVRTPKFNIRNTKDNWQDKQYTSKEITTLTIVEALFSLYFLFGIGYSFYSGSMELLPFYILAFFGFGATFWYSYAHAKVVKH